MCEYIKPISNGFSDEDIFRCIDLIGYSNDYLTSHYVIHQSETEYENMQ